MDDRVLVEAILPLLATLAAAPDVRPVLHRRFDMPRWFAGQGVSAAPAPPGKPAARRGARSAPLPAPLPAPASGADMLALARRGEGRALLLCDFDKTLTDCDAGERLVGELAPELAPMLASLQMPANFVPLTNAVLAEMARRGVSRDRLLGTLRAMGAEMPAASVAMLRWAAGRPGLDVRVLSDCNQLFISHMLTGAAAPPVAAPSLLAHADRRICCSSQKVSRGGEFAVIEVTKCAQSRFVGAGEGGHWALPQPYHTLGQGA